MNTKHSLLQYVTKKQQHQSDQCDRQNNMSLVCMELLVSDQNISIWLFCGIYDNTVGYCILATAWFSHCVYKWQSLYSDYFNS